MYNSVIREITLSKKVQSNCQCHIQIINMVIHKHAVLRNSQIKCWSSSLYKLLWQRTLIQRLSQTIYSMNTSYCLIEVVTNAGLTVFILRRYMIKKSYWILNIFSIWHCMWCNNIILLWPAMSNIVKYYIWCGFHTISLAKSVTWYTEYLMYFFHCEETWRLVSIFKKYWRYVSIFK